ncbi:MAG: 30S ribosomal protein S20 [Patescibacteria group bacterium]|jgi:small subunit ribosomal protein S20|nr:30S ribosomal protein S20 [Patescibacteria group bacterium]
MPQSKSAKKSLRQEIKRTQHNKDIKANIKYLVKQTLKAIDQSDKSKINEWMQKTQKAIDKAAKNNVFKKNTAARKKSGLMKKANKTDKKK